MSSHPFLSATLLSNEHLHCRDFGSTLLDVGYLNEWIAAKRLRLPICPDGDFVQVEWLLAAIQRSVQDSVTGSEAREIVLANPRLREHRCAESNPAWLLGGEAYAQWSAMIRAAITNDELVLLDFGSKLPVSAPYAAPAYEEDDDARGETGHEWITKARAMAAVMITRDVDAGLDPRKRAVAQEIADIFAEDGTLTKLGRKVDAEYVERRALQGWGDMVADQEKRKISA